MKLLKTIIYYILGIIGILFISVFPEYITTRRLMDAPSYLKLATDLFTAILNPERWLYSVQNTAGEFPILEVLWDPFIYSMQLLISAITIGLVLAFILASAALKLPRKIQNQLKAILNVFESIPDLMIAVILQMAVIFIYKNFGITIFNVASSSDKEAYVGPIITLSILPTITMFKTFLLLFEEEYMKDYVTFLKGKGISGSGILLKHVLRNIMPGFSHHLKIIIWGTLSSQFIVERLFNIPGLTFYLLESFTPMTIAFTLILLFTPFYFFFQLIDLWLNEESLDSYEIRKDPWWKKWSIHNIFKTLSQLFANLLNWSKNSVLIRYLKNWKFALGLAYFLIVIGYSSVYGAVTNDHVNQVKLYYAEDGVTLLGRSPFPPPEPFLLGSDRYGYSIFDQIIVGAKYTLVFGLIIAFLRVFLGLIYGVIYAFYCKPAIQKWLEKMIDSMHFVPMSLIAYILLSPILISTVSGFAYTIFERIILEIMILTVLVVPLTTVLIGKDIKHVLNQEFILTSKTLGGSDWHIFFKHVLPHIVPRLSILFGQQFIQVLLIFIHLGLFNIFFGGTSVEGTFEPSITSVSYEWSGLIGALAKWGIRYGYYWYLSVFVAFMLTIFAMQMLIQGIKEIQQAQVGIFASGNIWQSRKRKTIKKVASHDDISSESFSFINKNLHL